MVIQAIFFKVSNVIRLRGHGKVMSVYSLLSADRLLFLQRRLWESKSTSIRGNSHLIV